MSKGFMMFAHNNSEIDYLKLAVVNALLIQKNLGVKNITVVTDPHSLEHAEKTNHQAGKNKSTPRFNSSQKEIKRYNAFI